MSSLSQSEFNWWRIGKLEREFREYHGKNPVVYRLVLKFTRQWKARGGKVCGMQFLLERVRWEIMIKTKAPDFKINNNYAAFYARLIWEREPDLRGIFQMRRMKFPCSFGPPDKDLPPGDHVA